MSDPASNPFARPRDHEYPDALAISHARGRGAQLNPANRFENVRLHVLGEHLDEITSLAPDGLKITTQVFSDRTQSLINRVDSPDLPFSWTVNPYRGCEHGCIYCYARPGHEYLGLSCGVDFETKIAAKHLAHELLEREILKPSWRGEPLVFSGVTDCFQPIEAKLRITRRCLEVCERLAQPVSIITKNALVTRDLDLLQSLAAHNAAHVAVSVTSLDNRLASAMEPRASSPRDRLNAIEALSRAGIPTAVMIGPAIPALNESEIPAILKAAADAGAITAGYVMLRLPYQVKSLFLDWLKRTLPDRAAHVESAIRDVRDGDLSSPQFGTRMRGVGPRAEQVRRIFDLFARKHNLRRPWPKLDSTEFLARQSRARAIGGGGQLGLF